MLYDIIFPEPSMFFQYDMWSGDHDYDYPFLDKFSYLIQPFSYITNCEYLLKARFAYLNSILTNNNVIPYINGM